MGGFVGILAFNLNFQPAGFCRNGCKNRRKRSLIEVIQALKGKSSGDFL